MSDTNPRARCDQSCPRINEPINSPRLRGHGSSRARILLVGEAPGQNEDAQGKPFIGESGKLLRGILSTVGIAESDIYITNSVKCATADENQAPNPKTITCCRCYLEKEIKRLEPNVIGALGATALRAVLKRTGITKLKNNVFFSEEFETKVVPIYHPAYILRNPGALSDFQKGIEVLKREAEEESILQKSTIDAEHFDADTPSKIDEVLTELEKTKEFVFDLETSSLQFVDAKILCVALSWRAGLGVTIKWDLLSKEQLDRFQRILCSDRLKINHNLKFDLEMLMGRNIKVNGPYFDTLVAASVIDENAREKGLDALTLQHLDIGEYWAKLDAERDRICRERKIKRKAFSYDLFEYELLAEYAQWDADATFRLFNIFKPALEEQQLTAYFKKYSMPTMQLLVEMEFHGVRVNRSRLKVLIEAYREKLFEQSKSIGQNKAVLSYEKDRRKLAKRKIALRWHNSDTLQSRYPDVKDYVKEYLREPDWKFNQKSVPQLSTLLFDKLNLTPIKFSKRTKKPSTDEESLRTYAEQGVKLCQEIIEHRGLAKYISTYLVSTYEKSKVDRRIHANYLQAHTVTGRLCVDAATLITTDRGDIPICRLPDFPQAKALTHNNRFMPILNVWIKGFEEMFEVATSNGHTIICTQNHRFLTPHGWQKLNELVDAQKIQNKEMVFRRSSLPNHTCQTELSTNFYRRAVDQLGSEKKIPVNQQDNELVPRILQRGVQRATGTDKEMALLHSAKGKQTWEERTAQDRHSQSRAGKASRSGIPSLVNRRKIENFGMVCPRKHASVQIVPTTTQIAKAHAGNRFVAAEKAKRARSRAAGFSGRFLSESSQILSKAVHRVCASQQANLVHKRISKSVQLLYRKGSHSAKPYMLEHQQIRITAINCAASQQDTPHSSILVGEARKQLCLSSRFLFSKLESSSGNRWGFPSARQDNNATGRKKGKIDQTTGLHSAQIYTFGCGKEAKQNCKGYQEATIVSVRQVGVRQVWDIEVEKDHSYVAQGLINHNSCVAPNMQNIPRDAKDYKECLVADPGFIFVKADLKQAEFRCWAHYADDQAMIQDIESGLDIHKRTASEVFGIPESEVTDEQRTAAKAVVFGLMYGRGAKAVAKQYNLSIDQAEAVRRKFFAKYPVAAQWLKDQIAFVREHGFVKTWLGRYRRLPEIFSDDDMIRAKAERDATNAPIQGLASNMNDHFMVTSYKLAVMRELPCYPAVTQHDAQIFQVKESRKDEMVQIMKHVVKTAFPDFKCKMVLDFEVGKTLGTLEKYK